jgi:hypothetical protein
MASFSDKILKIQKNPARVTVFDEFVLVLGGILLGR